MCCQLWHIVQRPGHWPNKHRTNLRPHRPKWTEVCSTSHTKIEGPTSGLGRGQNSEIIYTVRKMKWSWAGHINRLKDDRWTSRVTAWRPYDKKRRQGRPTKRWGDDLDKYWSYTIWQRTAQDMGHLETTCWGLRPTTGHNGCLMMMMMMRLFDYHPEENGYGYVWNLKMCLHGRRLSPG